MLSWNGLSNGMLGIKCCIFIVKKAFRLILSGIVVVLVIESAIHSFEVFHFMGFDVAELLSLRPLFGVLMLAMYGSCCRATWWIEKGGGSYVSTFFLLGTIECPIEEIGWCLREIRLRFII